jgi:outer membrane protein assembly factor BamB
MIRPILHSLILTSALATAAFAQTAPAPPPAADHDWPQWRGPNRDGVSLDTGLIKKWPEGGPPLLYAFRGDGEKGCGNGYCPPTVVGNRAYLSGEFPAAGGKHEAWLFGFELPKYDALTPAPADEVPMLGKMLFKTKVGLSCISGENAAPVVVDDNIYLTTGDGDVAALNTDGKLLWSHSMKKDFNAHIQTNGNYGFSESPLIDGDKLIVCPGTRDAVMVAYNRHTGELLWKTENPEGGPRDAASHASTMLSNACGIKHYVNLTGWGLVGVSPEGKYLWGVKKTCESSIPSPIVKDDYVFAISAYGFGSIMIKLTKDESGAITPNTVWKLGGGECQCLAGQAVLVGDKIYVGNGLYAGNPTCVDFLTGKVAWRAKQEGGGQNQVISYDGMLIFRSESKDIVLIEANPKEYKLVAKFRPVNARYGGSPPVIARGLLYLRDRDLVQVYDLHQK